MAVISLDSAVYFIYKRKWTLCDSAQAIQAECAKLRQSTLRGIFCDWFHGYHLSLYTWPIWIKWDPRIYNWGGVKGHTLRRGGYKWDGPFSESIEWWDISLAEKVLGDCGSPDGQAGECRGRETDQGQEERNGGGSRHHGDWIGGG